MPRIRPQNDNPSMSPQLKSSSSMPRWLKLDTVRAQFWVDPQYEDEYLTTSINYGLELELNKIRNKHNGRVPAEIRISRKNGTIADPSANLRFTFTAKTEDYLMKTFDVSSLTEPQKKLVFKLIKNAAKKYIEPVLTNAEKQQEKFNKIAAVIKEANNKDRTK